MHRKKIHVTKIVSNTTMECVQRARIGRKKKPILALCGAVFVLSGLLTLATRATTNETWSTPQAREAAKIENVTAYETFAQALTLLDEGNKSKAQSLLDAVQPEPLIVTSGGMGNGMLRAYSPTTLLMALTRRLGSQATDAAKAGNAAEARLWLAYTAQLAEQVARSPQASIDSICLSHYLDMNLADSQVQVAQLLRDTRGQVTAEQRCQFLRQTWQTIVLPQLKIDKEAGHNVSSTLLVAQASQKKLREIQNRYSLYRIQAGLSAA